MQTLKKEYRDLEIKVLRTLRELAENSNDDSCQIHGKCLYLYEYMYDNPEFDYCELCIINDRLVLVDTAGYYESATETDIQTLIDIIEYANNRQSK